eukprot:1161318-Pelagomonas_calceolata.AAC.3
MAGLGLNMWHTALDVVAPSLAHASFFQLALDVVASLLKLADACSALGAPLEVQRALQAEARDLVSVCMCVYVGRLVVGSRSSRLHTLPHHCVKLLIMTVNRGPGAIWILARRHSADSPRS